MQAEFSRFVEYSTFFRKNTSSSLSVNICFNMTTLSHFDVSGIAEGSSSSQSANLLRDNKLIVTYGWNFIHTCLASESFG